MKFGISDFVYTMYDKSERSEAILSYLEKNNILDLRFGLNLVTVESLNPYGDINKLITIFKTLNERGFHIHLYLFLTDDIANAGQANCPKQWNDYSLEEISNRLKEDCRKCAMIFHENNIKIHSYTVGNESEWGICGCRIKEGTFQDGETEEAVIEWLKKNVWQSTAYLLKGCCEVLKEVSPESKIIIHSDSIGKESFTYEYINHVIKQEVPFDIIGLTYNPWTIWDEDYDEFKKIERTIGKLGKCNKPIWIVEYCYPSQLVTNGELTDILPKDCYNYTVEGQTNFHLKFIEFCEQHNIDMIYFWRGEHELPDDISHELGAFHEGRFDERLENCIIHLSNMEG